VRILRWWQNILDMCQRDSMCAIPGAELTKDFPYVGADGFGRDGLLRGDLLIGEPDADVTQDLGLAVGELIGRTPPGRR